MENCNFKGVSVPEMMVMKAGIDKFFVEQENRREDYCELLEAFKIAMREWASSVDSDHGVTPDKVMGESGENWEFCSNILKRLG